MFFVLSKILDLALAPLSWCVVLLLWALRPKAMHKRHLVACLVVLWGASVAPVAGRLQRLVEADWAAPSSAERYDAIVLLGGVLGTVAEDGTPGFNDNVERLHQSFEMLRSGAAREVVITGAFPGSALSEAEMLRDKLVLWGIDPARIVLENLAKNTRENAVYTAPILRERGYKTMGLVTSRYHMRRAIGCFRREGLELAPISVDLREAGESGDWRAWVMPRVRYLEMSTASLRELAGYWIYRVQGYV